MIDEKKLKQVYSTLQQGGYKEDYNTFKSGFTGNNNYSNRKQVYDLLSTHGANIGSSYEEFMKLMQKPKVGKTPMSEADKTRFIVGAKDIAYQGQQAVRNTNRYNTLKQRQQKQKNDFGRVTIGTRKTPYGGDADNVIKDDATGQYVTSDNQQTGNVAEAQERQAVLDEQNNAYQEAVNAGDIPSVFDVRDKNGNYDLQENIGKNGTYLTEEGAQNQLDKKLADAYARKKEIENAIAEDNQKNGNPLLSYSASLGGGNGRDAASSDYRNKLATSLALVTQQIGALEAVKQYPTSSWGEDAWKALDNTAFAAKTWDFGLTDFATMGQMERIKTKMDNGVPLSGSDKMLLKSKVGADAAAALEDEKMGNIYRWTKIAGQSLPFMADFFLTGGYGGITKGISRGALKIAAKRGMGKVSAAILKNTGIVMGDVIGSYAMAGTEQAMKTGADIMQRHMGNLYIDENGNYAFGTFDENGNLLHEGGETIGNALYKGLTSAMVENYTEKLFGHNYGIKKGALNFMEKHGMSRAADFFKNIGQSGWYAGSKKWMEKFGINGFAEEVMEEEIGIPLHALLDGEGKVSDLLDPKRQLDIIGGMAISVGSMYAMGIGTKPIKGAYNRAQYYRFKHKVDLADSEAQQLLGDNWEQLKEQMDNATNDKMGSVLYNILQQRDNMSKEQINAAILYGVNLMKMRGYNLTKTAEMNAKEITNEPTTPEEEKQEQIDNAYAEGHEVEAEDTHEIQIDQVDKQRSLAAMLGISEQQLSAMSNEELDALTGQNDNLDRAIYEYQLSNAKYQGVMDNAQDQVDLAAQRAASMTDMITDKTRGTVRNATIKGTQGANDYGVYIINGNLATHDDGAINISGSDQMIIYYDPTTGKVEHADASRFAALGDENPAEDVKAQDVADAKEKAIKEISGIIDGRVEVGTQFNVTDVDGTQHTYEVLADNGDGTAMITFDGNVEQNPYSIEDLQNLKDLEDQKRLEAAKAAREQLEAERGEKKAEQQKQEEEKQEQQNQVIADLIDDNGNVVLAAVEGSEDVDSFVVGEYNNKETGVKKYKVVTLNADGTVSKPRLVDSSRVSIIGKMSADEYKQNMNIPKTSDEEVDRGENEEEKGIVTNPTSASHGVEGKGLAVPNDSNGQDTNEQENVLKFDDGSLVPMTTDSKGRPTPDYDNMTAEQSAEVLQKQFGEGAEKVTEARIKKAEKALKDAEKMKVDYSGEDADIIEQQQVKAATIAAAKEQLEHAQNVKKAMTAKKVSETMAKTKETENVEGAHEAGSVAADKFANATRLKGNTVSKRLPGGEKVSGHYEIVPAESLTPSHDAMNDYKKSEGFPVDEKGQTINDRDYENDKAAQQITDQMSQNYNGQAITHVPTVSDEGIVYDGNGRTMAGQKAAINGTDAEYIEDLKDNAQNYGFTKEQIEQSGIEHPRLVMVTDERLPYDTATFAKFNRSEKKAQSNTEQAVAKAKTLTPDEVGAIISEIEGNGSLDAFFGNPKAINDLVKMLVSKGIIGQNDVPQYMDGQDRLSAQGKEFVKNLLLGAIFKPETIRMLGVDSALKTKAINGVRAVMENMKLGDYSLRDEIDNAISLLYEARRSNMSVDDLLRQSNAFEENARDKYSMMAQALAQALEGKSSTLFRDLLGEYNDIAKNYNTQEGSLDFYEHLSPEELVKEFLDVSKTIKNNDIKLYENEESRNREKEGDNHAASNEESTEEAGEKFDKLAEIEQPLGEQKAADEVQFSAKDNGKQETTEERTANVEKNKVEGTDVVDAIIGKKTRKALARIAKMMGAKIQYQYTDKLSNGWYDADTNTIYLTLDSSITEGVQFIFGHEMTHEIKDKNPAAFEELKNIIKNTMGEKAFSAKTDKTQQRYKKGGANYWNDRNAIEEEVVADEIGYWMRDLNYAHTLAMKMSHPLLAKIHEIINRIRMAFHGTEYTEQAKQIMRTIEQAYVATANREAENAAIQEGEGGQRLSLRTKEAPQKTQKVYKLMRLNPAEEGKLFPLFIGNGEAVELGKWYDADSPKLQDLTSLSSKDYVGTRTVSKDGKKVKEKYNYGAYLVNNETGEAMSLADFKTKYKGNKTFSRIGKNPNVAALNWATDNGYRWIKIEEKSQGQSRYGGENRSYYNYGINGTGAVSIFAMRPGWHAGSLPTMRQIGKGEDRNLRDDNFVWVEGEIPADIDYNEEAQKNPDKDIPDHIPTDGYYLKATNANKEASQADKVGWYVAGAFKANRIMSDKETRDIIDQWNAEHPDEKVEYDWKRESGKDFNAETMSLEDTPKFSLKVYHGSGADFSEFDFDHMGEGAGSQAFGWGGYVTSSEKIGKDYAQLSEGTGGKYQYVGKEKLTAEQARTLAAYMKLPKYESYTSVKEGVEAYIESLNKLAKKNGPFAEHSAERAKVLESILPKLDNIHKEDFIPYSRNLYEVNIPDDNGSNYLDWYAPVSDDMKQKAKDILKDGYPQSVKESQEYKDALREYTEAEGKPEMDFEKEYLAAFREEVDRAKTFGDIYDALSNNLSDKGASKLLSSLGYTGIKYPAGTIQGGAEEGDTNYVIFKPEDMQIAEHTKFSIKTWHGSQADFDHFDHSFMGSGEGAQAYGWGTYVSEVEGIAKVYAKQNVRKHNGDANNEYTFKAKQELYDANALYDKAMMSYNKQDEVVSELLEQKKMEEESLRSVKNKLEKAKLSGNKFLEGRYTRNIPAFEKSIKDIDKSISEETVKLKDKEKELDDARVILQKAKEYYDSLKPVRNLYTVEIPDDTGDNYVGWDEPLTDKQIDMWKNALLSATPKKDREEQEKWANDLIERRKSEGEPLTGQEAYYHIDGSYSSKKASMALAKAGFDGVKVIAQRNTGGNKEGKMNYVIFDENNAKITEHTKFSLKDPYKMSDNEKKERGEKLIKASAVDVESGIIQKKDGLSARKVAEQWWKDNVGEPLYYNTEIGRVEINDNSIKDSLAHRYSQAKLDAITSLPIGFGKAVYLGTLKDFTRDGNVNNHYFAYPINYDGKRNYVFCRAMQDANKNRLYVHEVFVADKINEGNTLQTAASQPHGGIALYKDILTNILSAAKIDNSSETSKENGEKVDGEEPKSFKEFLDSPSLKFSIKNEAQRKAAENAYNYAMNLRPNKHAQYALVDMARPETAPEYYEKKVLANRWKSFYDKKVKNDWGETIGNPYGNYKLFDLDRPFEEQVNEVKGNVPDKYEVVGKRNLNADNESGAEYKNSSQQWVPSSVSYQDRYDAFKKRLTLDKLRNQVELAEKAYNDKQQERSDYNNQLMKEYMDKHELSSIFDIPGDIWQDLRDKSFEKYQDELDELFHKYVELDKQLKDVKQSTRFSLKSMEDKPEGWKQANKKAVHIAEAIERDPKFSLRNLDGTLIKAGTYFSGGGLVEEGLKGIIDPVVAVEYDEKISGVYRNNFGQHLVTADVRDVDPKELVKSIDGDVEYFHASPVCKNYSKAKANHEEVELDKETAKSTADFINQVKPKVVTIENVKGYRDSDAMKIITDSLDKNGYKWDADVYNAADYGGYTNRERLIVRAVKDGELPEKPKKMARKKGWYEAVADIMPTLTEKKNGVAPWMDVRLKADGIDWKHIDKPLYVMGSAYADGKVPHAFGDELLPTLRTKSGDVIVMPDGKVYRANGRVLARVSGVSDDYKMPYSEALSHTIIGNGIPTQLTEHVIAPLIQGTLKTTSPEEDGNTKFSLKQTNDKFNSDLKSFIDNGITPDNSRFELGLPSKELLSAGFPNLPISMRVALLNKKAGMERHPFSPSDLYDMVNALQKPIAVFKYTKDNMRNLIIDLTRNGKHFLVGVTLDYRKGEWEVNSISGLFPKENHEWIKWIQDGKAIRIDQKEKVLSLINSLRTNPEEAERIDLNLDSAAKIVKDFENPSISEEKLQNEPKFSLRVDQFENDLEQWKRGNNLPEDAVRPDVPIREPNESAADFLKRVKEYRKQMALWKTAPQFEGHLLSDDTAQGQFNLELQRGSVLKRIAFQDSMLAIRKAQEAIMKEAGVDRLNIAEDAYTAENRSHGKGKNEFEEYNDEFLQPLRKAYSNMMKKLGKSYDNVKVYMMAKHGLERNAHMAFKKALEVDYGKQEERIKAYKDYKADMGRLMNDADYVGGKIDFTTWRQKDNAIRTKYAPHYLDYRYDKMGITQDYSGLSALFEGSDFEEAAADLVKDVEDKHGHEAGVLWNTTNRATKKILRDSYKAGMMSKEVYEYVRGMYQNYIPLRGWGDTNADQVWNYMGGGKGAFNQTLKEANGRGSLADDPIAYIENMAESGILINNKNWVKQHLLLLADNHPTSLLNLSKAWYIKTKDAQGNEEWIPASPNITANMTSQQVESELDAFQQRMEQMKKKGDATQKREHLEISYPQTNSEEREHEVRVMKDGEEYVIYVNGDPQLAQAMNNTRAHRVRQGIESSKFDRICAKVGRYLAAVYTSRSPLFILSNFTRDTTMTLASTAIREDARYNYLLRKNMLTHWNTLQLVVRYQKGTLREKVRNGTATKTEQMFYDFMMNGGETGFVSSLDVEDLKKKFKNDLKDMNRMAANPKKVGHVIMNIIETANRAIEDSNRFAIYMTSIQYGRSIDEAVNNAKDVTLNFNRKGTGEHGWQQFRNLFLFVNPTIQSLQTLLALAKHHPFKFTAVSTSWLVSGMLVPMVNNLMMSLFGGDDDKDKYWSFTKWDRRNNFIMWVPFTHNFVKIPLAQEFRGFYGVGDMIASKLWVGEKAEESWKDYACDLLGQVTDMLPLDPMGYDGNVAVSLMPNVLRPLFELAFNVDFTGKPLFKDSEYNKYDPNFTKAYAGTPDWLVRISRMVNSIGNDYPDVQQNFIDSFGNPRFSLNNPAVVDHVLSSYLGGAYTMGSQVLGLLTKALNDPRKIKMADIPLVSKFVGNPNDRPVSKKQGDEFWEKKEYHDRAANTMSKLKKQAKVDGDYSLLKQFYNSDEYKQYKLYDVDVKKYEDDKKKERAENNGEEYKAHKTNYNDIYKRHVTPVDDFEDMELQQIYQKLNEFKAKYDVLTDKKSYYNEHKAAIDAIKAISFDKDKMADLKKSFLDNGMGTNKGKDTYNADAMKKIREYRKRILSVLEKANMVEVKQQKAKVEANKK